MLMPTEKLRKIFEIYFNPKLNDRTKTTLYLRKHCEGLGNENPLVALNVCVADVEV